jgi:hypothetical protein
MDQYRDKNGELLNVGDKVRFLTIYSTNEEWEVCNVKGIPMIRYNIMVFRLSEMAHNCTKINI